ncbi:hypothetical protein V1282_003928 [Nitrobacteraceae bacterium AZCC 2146]
MAGKLKPLDVERETRPGKYADGDGLYLVVSGATSKNWSYRYYKDGKQRWLGLGSLKDVSLKDARLARDAARLRVKGDRSTPGVDIVQEKRAAREEARAIEIQVTLPTFEECSEIYIRERWLTWSKKHRDQWPSSLNGTPTRRSENSRSRRSSPATSTNCCGRSGLRSERRPIVSADGSKRSSRRISMLMTLPLRLNPG